MDRHLLKFENLRTPSHRLFGYYGIAQVHCSPSPVAGATLAPLVKLSDRAKLEAERIYKQLMEAAGKNSTGSLDVVEATNDVDGRALPEMNDGERHVSIESESWAVLAHPSTSAPVSPIVVANVPVPTGGKAALAQQDHGLLSTSASEGGQKRVADVPLSTEEKLAFTPLGAQEAAPLPSTSEEGGQKNEKNDGLPSPPACAPVPVKELERL